MGGSCLLVLIYKSISSHFNYLMHSLYSEGKKHFYFVWPLSEKKLWHFWNRREKYHICLFINGSSNSMFVILQTNGLNCFILAALKNPESWIHYPEFQNPKYQNTRIQDPGSRTRIQNPGSRIPEYQNSRIQAIQTI